MFLAIGMTIVLAALLFSWFFFFLLKPDLCGELL